jgi:hypothetical protein
MAEPPERRHGPIAESLGLPDAPTSVEYSDVFLFQLYPYASVHLGPEGMMGGIARDRVAGFWSALGYTPPAEPDHLAALLGLYASLAEREVGLDGAERALVREARSALMHEHLAPWTFPYLDRVRELAPPVYRAWAELLAELLGAEMRGLARPVSDALPLHLRSAAPLPDPRVEGAAAFLEGLLAPVRSGMIVTRADLASVAADADLALRAGERRYALEHLLIQNAHAVLLALGAEATRQGRAHDLRSGWLGGSAAFLRDRCHLTAALLRALATEGDGVEGAGPLRAEPGQPPIRSVVTSEPLP